MKENKKLYLGVNDKPSLSVTFLYGFQQAMVCISGLLVYPVIISDLVCAGEETLNVRVKLMSAIFIASGVATILQTTLGLRLSVVHGPAMAFLPPLMAHKALNPCTQETGNVLGWEDRIAEIQGSLFIAAITFVIIGSTGLAGALSRRVGPITIVPLMFLLAISIAPTAQQNLSLHWISLVMLCVVVTMAVYLENVSLPLPYFSFKNRRLVFVRVRVFGQFPFLLSILLVWFFCFVLTITGLEPEGGEARTDKNQSLSVLVQAPWIYIPYPGTFGMPRFSIGLCIGYVASCLSSIIENLGSYDMAAKVSLQNRPPSHAINRAIFFEGIGTMLAALTGVCTGVTTYTENVVLIHLTRVAARRTMQMAGCILILMGIFTKVAAVLAAIPEALIGGLLVMGIAVIAGVSLTTLQTVDLRVTRNLSVIGLGLIAGLIFPAHFEKHPINTGSDDVDQVLNMLVSIKMLVGGVVAFILDNTVPGATMEERGLKVRSTHKKENNVEVVYLLPAPIERLLDKAPVLRYLPFFASRNSKALSHTPEIHIS